jgi:hypothetical protein
MDEVRHRLYIGNYSDTLNRDDLDFIFIQAMLPLIHQVGDTPGLT